MDSSDVELMLPPPLARASSAALPRKALAAPSSSQPVFIEIEDSDDDGTPPPPSRLAVPSSTRGAGHSLQKTVSAPAVFAGSTIGKSSSSHRPVTDDYDSDELPGLDMAAIAPPKRDKGKGRAADRPLALSETEEDPDSDTGAPAKKKRKSTSSATKGTKAGGSGSDTTAGLSKAEQKKLEAQEKKKAKEREKAEKALAAAAEKEAKALLNASNKLIDRKEAAAEVSLDFSEALLQERSPFHDQIYTKLVAHLGEIKTSYYERAAPAAPCFPKIINWKRHVRKDWDATNRYWRPREERDWTVEEEPTILLYLSVDDVERAVEAGKLGRAGSGEGTLVDIVGKARAAHAADYQVFLMIQNLSGKERAKRSADNADWQDAANGGAGTGRKKKGKYNANVSMEDIEMELCRVMLAERCFIIRPEKWDEAVDWLVELTKDIGYRPYKRIERAREAYLNIDGRIESSDRGNLSKTYINQLACINGITEPMAVSIAAHYPTWRKLLNAYKQCASIKEKQLMLQGVPIGANVNGAATNRTIGAVASERVYIVLFSTDRKLDLSGNIKDVRARIAASQA